MLFVSLKISLFSRNLLVFLFILSSGILRIFYAEYITEAIFQITALWANKKKAPGGEFLGFFTIFFFSHITKDFNSFFFLINTAATNAILLHWHCCLYLHVPLSNNPLLKIKNLSYGPDPANNVSTSLKWVLSAYLICWCLEQKGWNFCSSRNPLNKRAEVCMKLCNCLLNFCCWKVCSGYSTAVLQNLVEYEFLVLLMMHDMKD